MEFAVSVEGLDRMAGKSRLLSKIATEEISKALLASAQAVEKEAKQSILSGGKTGRTYRRGNVTHRASAPGEAPASDTGRLVNSINSSLTGSSLTAVTVAGRGTVKYAAVLEFGTSRIAPRPFLFPALERTKPFIRRRFDKALDRAIDRATAAGVKSLGK